MKKYYLILILILSNFSPIEGNSSPFVVHYMWGLWDTTPLPNHLVKIQVYNNKILSTKSVTHEKSEILDYVARFSHEHDIDYFELFQKIPRKVSQADLGRYIIIYYEGGMYCDLDVVIKKPHEFLRDLEYKNGVWLTEKVIDPEYLGPREKPYAHRIAQYAFFSKEKKCALLLEIIHEAFRRVQLLFQECGDQWSDLDVLWATGPDVVTTVLHETLESDYKILDLKQTQKLLKHQSQSTWRDGKDGNSAQ